MFMALSEHTRSNDVADGDPSDSSVDPWTVRYNDITKLVDITNQLAANDDQDVASEQQTIPLDANLTHRVTAYRQFADPWKHP
jgi:hypothetical protein